MRKFWFCIFRNELSNVVVKSRLKSNTFLFIYVLSAFSLLVMLKKDKFVKGFLPSVDPVLDRTQRSLLHILICLWHARALTQPAGGGRGIKCTSPLNNLEHGRACAFGTNFTVNLRKSYYTGFTEPVPSIKLHVC